MDAPIPPNIINTTNVCVLDDKGKLKQIHVFQGNTDTEPSFSKDEQSRIDIDQPEIVRVNQRIHSDDSIRTIKKKIIKSIGTQIVSYDELYLFIEKEDIVPFSIYYDHKTISSENEFNPIIFTKEQIGQLLFNLQINSQIVVDDVDKITLYSYKNIMNTLDLSNKEYVNAYPLGMQFSQFHELLFSANPFCIIPSEPLVYTYDNQNIIQTLDNTLLMSSGKLKSDTIYVCLATDVLKYAENNAIESQHMIQLYYPLLSNAGITSLDALNKEKQRLIVNNKKIIGTTTDRIYKNIDAFYNIYKSRSQEINYSDTGIKSFEITLHPSVPTRLPIELIFRKIHVSVEIPFIKWNQGSQKEYLYRLYSNEHTKTYKRIPILSKTQINVLTSQSIKPNLLSFAYMFNAKNIKDRTFLLLELKEQGDVVVRFTTAQPFSKNKLTELFNTIVNKILKQVNDTLEYTNSQVEPFKHWNDPRIECNRIHYSWSTDFNKKIKPNEINGTLFGAFHIINPKISEGAFLRFKRVKNYTEMDAKNALISQIYRTQPTVDAVVNALMVNFSVTNEEAREQFAEYMNQTTLIRGQYVNKSIDIASNPGFPCVINIQPFDNRIVIDMKEIDSVHFIDILHMYIDSFLRVTQFPSTTTVKLADILEKPAAVNATKDDSHVGNVIINQRVETQPLKFDMNKMASMGDFFQTDDKDAEEDADDDDNSGILFSDDDDDDDDDDAEEDAIANKEGEDGDGDGDENDGIMFSDDDEEEGEPEAEPEGEPEAEPEGDENDGIMFSDDDDSDDDDPDENDSDDNDNQQANVLAGGYAAFFNKLKKHEPQLFRTKKDGQYDSYARACSSTTKRQPIILTDDEKKRIDTEYAGSYDVAMKYGTDPNNKFWYICPRYWCIKNNAPMTKQQVDNGECGGKIIPSNAKTPPDGHYIYEFSHDRQHKDKNGNYIQHYPGFLPKTAHPDHCLPCCFKSMTSNQQIIRRNECNITTDDITGNTQFVDAIANKSKKKDYGRPPTNIIGVERFPLPESRWGFLPLSVELFLNTNNKSAVKENKPSEINPNMQPLLRYGVEAKQNQSFIACIADVYSYLHSGTKPTIKEMRGILTKAINLDTFVTAHNGSLVSTFLPRKHNVRDVDTEKYVNTRFYKSFGDLANPSQNTSLKNAIASYMNFKLFMASDDSFIDHTYLWDFVTQPNSVLFQSGLNMIIMEMVDNDITDNIELLCPTNTDIYDQNKGSIILLKNREFYEPIYSYGYTDAKKSNNEKMVVKIFKGDKIPSELKGVLFNIRKVTESHCKPKASMPRVYDYISNINANKIVEILQKNQYDIRIQVSNYRNQIIGLCVATKSEDSTYVFVPTAPSNMVPSLKRIFADDVEWNTYEYTRDFLQQMHMKTNKEIKSKPAFKVMEDGVIVGIFTETNQFVQTITTNQNDISDTLRDYNIHSYKDGDYFATERAFATSSETDAVRTETIRNMSLETQFYSSFRNKAGSLLSDHMNEDVRNDVMKLIQSKEYIYYIQLQKLVDILRTLMQPNVTFFEINDAITEKIRNSSLFADIQDIKEICMSIGNNICVPKKGLMIEQDNEEVYYIRLADELLRYKRIQQVVLHPRQKILQSKNEYDISEDEILILQSSLNDEYYNELEPYHTNPYISYVGPSITNPIQTQKYDNKIKLGEQEGLSSQSNDISMFEEVCIMDKTPVPSSGVRNWSNVFPKDSMETIIRNETLCSFYPIIYILQKRANITENVLQIKKRLWQAYQPYLKDYENKIVYILSNLGKQQQMTNVATHNMSLETVIMDERYSMSVFDLWLLCDSLNLPVILYSKEKLVELNLNADWLHMGVDTDSEYFFIRYEKGGAYSINNTELQFASLPGFDSIFEGPDVGVISIQDFLETFKTVIKRKRANASKK
jgi:hypothetical protein